MGTDPFKVFDTNTFTYQTNWFQCFDIDLTNGLNSVTIHATDLAGNVTVTNFSYTLDYSTATNPPVITLNWPQNATQIAGTNFALRGIISDPTATVSAQIVDTNGTTNLVFGLVERSGLIWVEGLPLNGGSNQLTLTATDAAGNVTTTNINVIQSPLGLTVDDYSGKNLYGMTITVTGTLSDNDYTVWVNGVIGTNNGDGTWTALNVPLNVGGTAIVQARAVPNTDNGGEGTPSALDMGNPTSPNAVDVNPEIDKPARVYLSKYVASWSDTVNNYSVPRDHPQGDTSFEEWDERGGGYYQDTQNYYPSTNGYNIYRLKYTWPADGWPTALVGSYNDYWDSGTGDVTGKLDPFNVDWEHAEDNDSIPLENEPGAMVNYSLNIESALKLDTGGKAIAHSDSIFAISVSAVERGTFWNWGEFYTNRATIDPGAITTPLGNPGEDGIVWTGLADGETVDVTPRTCASRFSLAVNPTKYREKIYFNGVDITGKTTNTVVGQQIYLSCGLDGANPPTITNFQWTVPAYAISNFVANDTNGTVYESFPKTNGNVLFYWVDGGKKKVGCAIGASGRQLSAKTTFSVIRPSIDFIGSIADTVAVNTNYFGYNTLDPTLQGHTWLHFGSSDHGGDVGIVEGIYFAPTNINLNGYEGSYDLNCVQLGTSSGQHCQTNGNSIHIEGSGLDTKYPYGNLIVPFIQGDAPGSAILAADYKVSRSDSFQMYLLFQPSSPSIPVPLKVINWNWSGTASLTGTNWSLTSSNVAITANNQNTTSYPGWMNNVINDTIITNTTCQ